jgi:hypothetical protein
LDDAAIPTFLKPQAPHDVAGAIVGVVIEHDEFEIRIILGEQRTDTGLDIPGFVARRNEDGD